MASPGEGLEQQKDSGRQILSPEMPLSAQAAAPSLPRCGKEALTPEPPSPTENIHFSDAHTLGITGNWRLYIEVGTTLPSPRRAGVASHVLAAPSEGGGMPGSSLWLTGSHTRPLQGCCPEPQGRRDLLTLPKGPFPCSSVCCPPHPPFQRRPARGPGSITATAAGKNLQQSSFLTENCISARCRDFFAGSGLVWVFFPYRLLGLFIKKLK